MAWHFDLGVFEQSPPIYDIVFEHQLDRDRADRYTKLVCPQLVLYLPSVCICRLISAVGQGFQLRDRASESSGGALGPPKKSDTRLIHKSELPLS